MKAAILGGGFGLYGYLPALVHCGITAVLPNRYRERVLARPELACYSDRVDWHADEALLDNCDAVILALPPYEQPGWVKKCLEHDNIIHLFLEKPLAVDPFAARDLLSVLQSSGRNFRIGYNFRFTGWGKQLLQQRGGAQQIMWKFKAHHYATDIHPWKRLPQKGGGALRFYGIHLIALLAELGYDTVLYSSVMSQSPDEAEQWAACFAGPGLATCELVVSSNDVETTFLVEGTDPVSRLAQPFATESQASGQDDRIPYLIDGIVSLRDEAQPYYPWYKQVNRLWALVEARTIYSSAAS